MADFLDSEAEIGTTDEESDESMGGGEAVRQKKTKSKKKKRRKAVMDSDEEEEGEDLDGNLDDLIDDGPEELEEESGDEVGPDGKRKHEESDLEEDLDEDDLDLIEENLGIKVNRQKKLKRIRRMSDSDESDAGGEQGQRDEVAREIFDGDDNDEAAPEQPEPQAPAQDYGDLDVSEESDPDDFIVDEDGQPISKGKKKKKHIIHEDAALQEAQDIFGVDFDFEEFQDFGEYEDEEEDEEDYEDDELIDNEEGEPTARPKARKAKRKSKHATTIFEVFEPSELERGHFTDRDAEIRAADLPERFQLRATPVGPAEEGELSEEAEWICKHFFSTSPISRQEYFEGTGPEYGKANNNKNAQEITVKIHNALNFIRNQHFEVPFIAFYRKESVEGGEDELNIQDLWKIYHSDEKWMQLRSRKQALVTLFQKMQNFQFDQIDPDQPLESHVRALTQEDIDRAKGVQSLEELRDVYQHFLLYYGAEIPKMKNAARQRKRREREERGEDPDQVDGDDDEEDTLKQASRKTGYTMCVKAQLADFARKFGLTPEEFGENMRDNYQRHDVDQDPAHPHDLAHEFISSQFSTAEDVLKGARHMVAMQIAHDPLVRQCVRETFRERAKITLKPTKKGLKMIDESHICYKFKYLTNKPAKELADDQFLKITQAEEDGLLEYELHIDDKDTEHNTSYFEEIKQLYYRDEFSNLVQEWNAQRSAALERALSMILYPQMTRELKGRFLEEAKESVVKATARTLYHQLIVGPYVAENLMDDEDDEFDSSKGVRVMGLAYSVDRDEATFCALIDGDGEVTDHMRLVHIKNRKNSWRKDEAQNKMDELEKLKSFILSKKPHVIAVSAVSREAATIVEDLVGVIGELEQEHQIPRINVELVDNDVAFIFANSKRAEQDFREYPPILRQAISIARRLQDPIVEYAQLCNDDDDILCLRLNTMQDTVSKEDLLHSIHLEFINRVNEMGVDVNRCVAHPHTAPLMQFVCGLGVRKGANVIKTLKQKSQRLENRTQLVTMCNMGAKVFINTAGFIKIDTTALGDSTEAYIEVLDGTRVHPETYEWARKMAVDALEYDDTAEDANPAGPAGALEEILESPERLKDLDLDAFADELERQGYGHKHTTLYDIRQELNERYKDLRLAYQSANTDQKFFMLTKETTDTFYVGKLVLCTVVGFAHKRPHGEQLDNANPERHEITGQWQCPFCQKNDFPELSEVWNHFDAGECPGQAVGVRCRLDNGVSGFIGCKNLSDKNVTNPEERVKVGMTLHARILKIDTEKFSVDLTTKTSDLADKEKKFLQNKDAYYDYDMAESETKREIDKSKNKARQTYVKRVIAHPSFHNIDYKSCERMMATFDQGDVIIRPSSKGTDRLTVTWKVADGVLQHIDVKEEGKENAFSLGSSLLIDREEFEDLDEIIARYIQPMASFARDILHYKCFKEADGGQKEILDKILIDDKRKQPSRIPYYLSASKQYPGKFMLGYLPRKTPRYEFVSVTPEGLRYRQQMFATLNHLVKWFKEHFRDPIPGTPSIKTPQASGVGGTPTINLQNVDAATIQRAAAGLPSSVYNTLQQVAEQTPYGGGYNQFQAPVATPMMTPMMTPMGNHMMTPSQHPVAAQPMITTPSHGGMGTPQYQPTPRASWGAPPPGGSTPRSVAGAGGSTPSRTPSRTPTQTTPQRSTPSRGTPSQTSQDWAKMAELWARKNKADEQPKSRRTPRHGQSPMDMATPGGDTPLFDER